jgi:hypothetical protein
MLKIVMDGCLHVAPTNTNQQRILDISCGTGTWCIDMGGTYPGGRDYRQRSEYSESCHSHVDRLVSQLSDMTSWIKLTVSIRSYVAYGQKP